MNTIIIAEAGVNHNGDFALAEEMIYKAAEAGADYVKFQTAIPELVISTHAKKADYQIATTGDEESQLDMVRAILLPLSDYERLKAICGKAGIGFLSTPFDLPSIELLAGLDMDYFKVPSGEITNYPYLRAVGRLKKKIILSTGMATLSEVDKAMKVLVEYGTSYNDIILLHCTTEYPAPKNEVNLKAMQTMRDHFGLEVGYSDHTQGIEIPIAAVAMGAVVIEKHFTLDCNLPGPDQKASLEPAELKNMVDAIRNVESAIGNGDKQPADSEIKNIGIARRSIVAANDINKGEIFTEENIIPKRPGTGISPMRWEEVIGMAAVRDFEKDELIEL